MDAVLTRLQEKYGVDRKVEVDSISEPVIWAKDPQDAKYLVKAFMIDLNSKINFLSDVTAYENLDKVDGDKRFVLVYQLYSTESFVRIRIKTSLELNEEAQTISDIFSGANWLEREVYDMFGIKFKGHPNLRRIMMDERFTGHPLRKEYPMKQREPFANNIALNLGASEMTQKEERTNLSDLYNPNVLLNLGPAHPATHGTLRVMCRANGEVIEDAACEIGYLHRAIEKLGEEKTYHQWMVYTDRLNYCSALNNNVTYAMAVENILGIQITDRCMWIRMICMELSRIIDHLVCLAANIMDCGGLTVFFLLIHWREEAYTMIESMCGMRLTTSYARIGGMSYDLPDNFEARLKKFCEDFPKAIDEMEQLVTHNRIWIDRTKNVGVISKEDALKLSITGPSLRASGINHDLRRDRPYYGYSELDFDVVIGSKGDVYDRYLVRVEEMRQSTKMLSQCLSKLPKGPLWVEDKRVRIPDKIDVYTKMEVLIHHFKIFMEGIDVPKGEAFTCTEGPNGEVGFYIVSRGGPKAWRMRVKSPSFMMFQAFEASIKGAKISDAVAHLGSVNIIAGELDR